MMNGQAAFEARRISARRGPRAGALTDEQVIKIRLEYARAYKSSSRLAAEHSVSQGAIMLCVQGSTYRYVGGLITWPGERTVTPAGKNRGHCWDVACTKPIAASGWAQRMHLCDDCFRINGGRKCGRTREGKRRTFTCRVCRMKFEYYVSPNGYHPRTCSHRCSAKDSAAKRSLRPSTLTRDVLYELYWGQNLTAADIAKRLGIGVTAGGVRHWLVSDDIPRRAPNWRRYAHCAVEGCERPKHQAFNGIRWYGRLCKEHWRERDMRRRRFYQEQIQREQGGDMMTMIARFTAGLPESVKRDAESEIMIAALSMELPLPLSRESVKPLIAKVFRENADAYKFVSLAAPTREGEGVQTWGERLGIS